MKNANSAATAVALGLTAAASATTGQAQSVRAHAGITFGPQPAVVAPGPVVVGQALPPVGVSVIRNDHGEPREVRFTHGPVVISYGFHAGGQGDAAKVDVVAPNTVKGFAARQMNEAGAYIQQICHNNAPFMLWDSGKGNIPPVFTTARSGSPTSQVVFSLCNHPRIDVLEGAISQRSAEFMKGLGGFSRAPVTQPGFN